jgi:hypothetical protein
VTARLALRMGRPELARDALVAAFFHYRSDPWPSQVSMSHALALADELTLARPDMAPVLFEVLSEPFAVAALDVPRLLVRLSVASHSFTRELRRDAIAPFEPHVAWRSDVLRFRAGCYERTRDSRVYQARADLAQYERLDSAAGVPVTTVSPTPQ